MAFFNSKMCCNVLIAYQLPHLKALSSVYGRGLGLTRLPCLLKEYLVMSAFLGSMLCDVSGLS